MDEGHNERWLQNLGITAENIRFNISPHNIRKPMEEGNNERWLNNAGIAATGKPLRGGPPTTR